MSNTWKGVLIGILCFVVLASLTLLIDGFLTRSEIWHPSPEEAGAILLLIVILSTLLGLGIAKQRKRIKVVSLILISIFILHFSYGLTYLIPAFIKNFFPPPIEIIIMNHTDEVLTITMNEDLLGTVETSSQISVKRPKREIEYAITAKNAQGEIVLSQTFVEDEVIEMFPHLAGEMQVIENIGDNTYKVVIPPLREGSESSDNTTDDNVTGR